MLFIILLIGSMPCCAEEQLPLPDHPDKRDFLVNLNKCRLSSDWCELHTQTVIDQAIRLANEYSTLLIPDVAQSIFQDAYFHVDPSSPLGMKFNHILGTLAFSQGDVSSAEKYWSSYNRSDLVSLRSLASQVVMKGNEEKKGLDLTAEYIDLLRYRFQGLLWSAAGDRDIFLHNFNLWSVAYWRTLYLKMKRSLRDLLNQATKDSPKLQAVGVNSPTFVIDQNDERSFAAERSELVFLELLLNEAQGQIRMHTSTNDLALNIDTMEGEFSSAQRFRLAVGLAKLGLFDLSLRHVWLSATPWEAPLYLLRARLVFAPVQKNMRQLALAVDNFETQAEQILAQPPTQMMHVPLMERVCDSPNEAALALQSLPLLHLAGYSSPRHSYTLGHSPVALSVLLSEVYRSICPVQGVPSHLGPLGPASTMDGESYDSIEGGIERMERVVASLGTEEGDKYLSMESRGVRKKRKRKSTHSTRGGSGSGKINGEYGTNDETLQPRKYESAYFDKNGGDAKGGANSSTITDRPSNSLSSFSYSPSLVKIGVVSGSLDGVLGKITVGFVESIRRKLLHPLKVELIAMCFPTPRDDTTDRARLVFDRHINLSPTNKTQAIHRIWQTAPDFVIFTDALLDSRVFALAHERLAAWQGALWGWGSTLGVNTIDYYFVSEPLWYGANMPRHPKHGASLEHGGGNQGVGKPQGCPIQKKRGPEGHLYTYGPSTGTDPHDVVQERGRERVHKVEKAVTGLNDEGGESYAIYPPSELFSEQVVFLRGLPPLPVVAAARRAELWSIMRTKYFLPMPTRERSNHLHALHLYLFPGSVRHMHPEFDQALYILLKTDPAAMVIMAVPKTGRDNLPTVHTAVRHDLMHPTMPAAAAAKLKQRLRESLGSELCKRLRVLPPLEERIYHSLRRNVIAVLDPYPVGAHVAVLEAMKEGVPVVSAPGLQECTNSHAMGIARALRLSKFSWPTTAEEYAVEAIRLQREEALRLEFVPPDSLRTSFIPRPRSMRTQQGEQGPPTRMGHEINESDVIEMVGDVPGESSHGEQLAFFVASLVEGAHGENRLM